MAFKWNFKNLRKQAVNNKAKFHEYVSCSSNEYSSQQTLNTLYLFIYRKTWKYIYVVDNWFITGKTSQTYIVLNINLDMNIIITYLLYVDIFRQVKKEAATPTPTRHNK